MVKAYFAPAVGEQFNSCWRRNLKFKGKDGKFYDLKFFTKDSHFQMNIALQCCYYGITGTSKDEEASDANKNPIKLDKDYSKDHYRNLIGWPKNKTLITDSVDYEETIIIRKIGEENVLNVQIGNFVDELINKNKVGKNGHEFSNIEGYEVLTIDNNFKICWKKIKQVIRHKTNKEMIEILSIGGKSVCTTKDHTLIQLKDINSFKTKRFGDLKKNKTDNNNYIISYDKIDLPEIDIDKFDIKVKYFKEEEIFTFYITELELKILGYIIGDGYISKTGFGVSGMSDHNLKKLIKKFCKKYNVNVKFEKNGHDSMIASTKLSQVLWELGFNGHAHTKEIPSWILNLPKEKIGWFLSGYYSADGSIIIKKNSDTISEIGISTVSKKLHLDTKLLLDKLGIKYNCGIENSKWVKFKNKRYWCKKSYKIKTYDVESFRIFKKYIIFHHKEKKEKQLTANINYNNKIQHANLPCDVVKDFCKFRNQHYIAKHRVKHSISKSDIGCFRIKNINKFKKTTDYVYDISVDDVERFLCSGVLVHNSAGFQMASFKRRGEECKINPMDSLRWQEANADIAMNLDIPSTLYKVAEYDWFKKALSMSVENFKFFEKNRKNFDMKLYNVLHGETLKLMEEWYDAVKHFDSFNGWAVGVKPPFDPMIQAMGFMFLWEKGEIQKDNCYGIHLFGTSGKHVVPTIVYMASKLQNKKITYDSSSYNIGSIYRTYYMPFDIGPHISFGEKYKRKNPHLKELPCQCPVCSTIEGVDILNGKDIYAGALISLHNMYQYHYYNEMLNKLVYDKELFLDYLRKINISKKTLKSIEFIDYAMEKGLNNAVDKFKPWLIPQSTEKTKQADIFGF